MGRCKQTNKNNATFFQQKEKENETKREKNVNKYILQ